MLAESQAQQQQHVPTHGSEPAHIRRAGVVRHDMCRARVHDIQPALPVSRRFLVELSRVARGLRVGGKRMLGPDDIGARYLG